MTNEQFEQAWAVARPHITELLTAYLVVDGWKDSAELRMTHRVEMVACVRKVLSDHGLTLERPTSQIASIWPGVDVDTCVEWVYYRVKYSSRSTVSFVTEEEPAVEIDYIPVVRINAPAWFKRADFMTWLCADTTATWHKKLEITETLANGRLLPTTSRTNNMVADSGSDAFFTWSGVSEGSDSPDGPTAGIPTDIWEYICDKMWDAYGFHAEALIWVTNLE